MLNKLWVEAYRPQTLAEVILASDHERVTFQAMVDSGSMPNLLLLGHQGTGKSSMSRALMHEFRVDSTDVLKINCSDEKIDAMRDKVKTFAYTMPMGEFRVVRLEEMDNLSQDAQKLLRVLIEEVSSSCRFVATGNYANRIIPALKDRFQSYVFATPNREHVLVRAAEILEKEGITFELDDLEKVVEAGYPSIRQVIQLLEKSSRTGTLMIRGAEAISDWKLQLLPLLEASDLRGARKLVCESATREELQDVYRFLYENTHRVPKLKGKEDQAVVTIAQYQYQHGFVADQEIQVAAMFIELGAL